MSPGIITPMARLFPRLTVARSISRSSDQTPETQLNPKKKIFETIQPVRTDSRIRPSCISLFL